MTIQSPAAGATFAVGQIITLTGSATDTQDGDLPSTALQWTVLRHHDTHTHPWFSGTGNNLTFAAPAPEDLSATNNSYIEVRLTVTDSGGASTTATRDVQPRKVAISFATNPSGLNVVVNGTTMTAPTTITSWQGWQLSLNAPSPGKVQVHELVGRWGAVTHGNDAGHTDDLHRDVQEGRQAELDDLFGGPSGSPEFPRERGTLAGPPKRA